MTAVCLWLATEICDRYWVPFGISGQRSQKRTKSGAKLELIPDKLLPISVCKVVLTMWRTVLVDHHSSNDPPNDSTKRLPLPRPLGTHDLTLLRQRPRCRCNALAGLVVLTRIEVPHGQSFPRLRWFKRSSGRMARGKSRVAVALSLVAQAESTSAIHSAVFPRSSISLA